MQPVSPLNRTAVFVENVERSAAFYLEVLGLELYATEEDLEPALLPDLLRVLGLEGPASMRSRGRPGAHASRTRHDELRRFIAGPG
jgi:catechol 2,3-dioxygenase-like lactoylglutathione lyase family enzyme